MLRRRHTYLSGCHCQPPPLCSPDSRSPWRTHTIWIYTTQGFISCVTHNRLAGSVLVRARSHDHLTAILSRHLGDDAPTAVRTPRADYIARAVLTREEFGRLLAGLAGDVTYPNFKNAAHGRGGPGYDTHLLNTWSDALRNIGYHETEQPKLPWWDSDFDEVD